MKVVKFGGSSLSNAQQFQKVKDIIEDDEKRQVVVVSALGKRQKSDDKITDLLYILYAHMRHGVNYDEIWQTFATRYIEVRDLLRLTYPIEEDLNNLKCEIDAKRVSEDYLVSRGEYLTGKLVANFLNFTFVDAKEVIFFQYNGKFDEEKIARKIHEVYEKDQKIVVPGFYGSYPSGEIKLMSRGGSDITGSLLAAGLQAEVYENWTDVSGILMTDPTIVENPATIEGITYQELRELSYMGASVLHEAAILPLQEKNIPLNIRNTNDKEAAGTLMGQQCSEKKYPITGIAGKKDFLSLLLFKEKMSDEVGFLSRTMKIFEEFHVSIEHVPTGIDHLGVVISKDSIGSRLDELMGVLQEKLELDNLEVVKDLALIAVVGEQMKGNVSLLGEIFAALSRTKIEIPLISQSSQQMSLIMGVGNSDYEKALQSIYQEVVGK